jgi:hypothetical protein
MPEYPEAVRALANMTPDFIEALQSEMPKYIFEGQLCELSAAKLVELCKEKVNGL